MSVEDPAGNGKLHQALTDLVDHGATIERLVAKGKDTYDADEMLQAAAEALLIRAGESVQRADAAAPEFIGNHPELELRPLKNARNVVAHGYDIVDADLVWSILADHFPRVISGVRDLLREF